MKFTEEILELFEKHLRGILSSDQEKELQDNLAADPELQESFELFKLAEETSSLLVEKDLSDHLRSLKDKREPVVRSINWKMITGIAAMLVIVASLAYFMMHKESNITQPKFIDLGYQKVDFDINRGSINEASDESKLYDIKLAYTRNRYVDVINTANSITDPALKEEADYILAHVYYEQGEFEKAIDSFEALTKVFIGQKHDQCEFNMMLAWFKLGEKEKSSEIMNRILSSQNHYFMDKTLEFKKKMKL
jgi:tetratricopeptide (TPR) repeat protein